MLHCFFRRRRETDKILFASPPLRPWNNPIGLPRPQFLTYNLERTTKNFFRREELRVICGTRGIPGTVAPFRAWRGSRDLVAQSPKFHAPAHAHFRAPAEKILTHSPICVAQGDSTSPAGVSFRWNL